MENPKLKRTVHLICEIEKADFKKLNDKKKIKELIKKCSDISELKILKFALHKFKPQGITAVALIASSHISIHTWPEHGYASFDLFSCKKIDNKKLDVVVDMIKKELCAKKIKNKVIRKRGLA